MNIPLSDFGCLRVENTKNTHIYMAKFGMLYTSILSIIVLVPNTKNTENTFAINQVIMMTTVEFYNFIPV